MHLVKFIPADGILGHIAISQGLEIHRGVEPIVEALIGRTAKIFTLQKSNENIGLIEM
jgi:hypothetical protein